MTAASFPQRLREKRKERKLTQANLAEETKVSPQAVSQWETGQTKATHANILTLARILRVDWEWLGYDAIVHNPDKIIPELAAINTITSSAPYLTNFDVIKWHEMFANSDVETWDYLDIKYRDNQDERVYEVFETRFSVAGLLIVTAIEDDSMMPELRQEDRLFFDTGLLPIPGDTVIAILKNGRTKNLSIRRLRQTSNMEGNIVDELIPNNMDFAKTILKSPESGMILGTLTETHRYRKMNFDDERLPSRRARSWETYDREEAERAASDQNSSDT